MGSTDSSNLPYIQTSPKIIFFTDFDGTITLKDSESAINCFCLLPFRDWNAPHTDVTFDRQ